MAIKVKAVKKGWFGGIREKGDVFEVESEEDLGSWMEVLEKPKSKKKVKSKPQREPEPEGKASEDENLL